ncbi:MAP microtubule affinity-regulating kinase 1 [Kappamyces sp. JEL0680]|nr:MAP microtubule affinity-regulating kinase 1 [Kappamyces sp. JEL0680]
MSSSKSKSGRRDKDDTSNPDVTLPGIGNYLFQKTVGEGNFAKVKLATHKITGAEVAIKVIDKTTLDEKKIGKLYREVRIMKMLHHPNIIKLYEVIETKYTVFLVMEYASGGELYDYLVVHGKMKEKDARAKFRQILSAVSYCHKKRVIHRDLKAENLLLDHNLDIKIADFGFSNYFDPEAKLDTFCGSPPYAAPELFQGRRYTGPEVDVWSLGVILYVLTTGCLPFDGKNLQEMREAVCRGKYRIPFFLSDNCEKLLKKFLVRDPIKRHGLEILIDDPWINETYTDSPISTDSSTHFEEDESIIKLMEVKYKLEKSAIIQALRDNVYNDISAIYFLLYYDKEAKSGMEDPSVPDVTKINNPSPKKESLMATEKEKAMPIIGEDDVLQETPEQVSVMEDPEHVPSGQVMSATTSKPPMVASGRRKRAATTGLLGDLIGDFALTSVGDLLLPSESLIFLNGRTGVAFWIVSSFSPSTSTTEGGGLGVYL